MSDGDLKLELLLDLGALLAREVELDELLKVFGERVASALKAERATLWMLDSATGDLRSRVANLPELDELTLKSGQGVAGHVAQTGKLVNIRDALSDARFDPRVDEQTGYRTRSMLCVPILDSERRLLGVVQVLNRLSGEFSERDESFLVALAEQISRALQYTTLRRASGGQGVALRGPYNHIVGSSLAMQRVYDKILKAARTDATVLLQGETGTGKGLFARAIHVNSPRGKGPLVSIDCTNLPASLVESELFGHERGAYTGADRRIIGKVEQAAGGTLFLDEIGELPLDLQSKLLRFLQERCFERVGGRETHFADVRIVAATNRNLEEMITERSFRADLFYRLRVVDVMLPPLRDRGPEDLLALADHFVDSFCRRYDKPSMRLSAAAREVVRAHSWPGNVRELEHIIERAVVLAATEILEPGDLALAPTAVPLTDLTRGSEIAEDLPLDDAIRAYARAMLRRHQGNRSATARALQIGRNRLARILDED